MVDNPTAERSAAAEFVMEWAPFTLKPGVDEATLLAASDALQAGFLSRQPGFIRRELLKGKDGQWVDVVYWRSRADAEQIAGHIGESPEVLSYFNLMAGAEADDLSAGVSHFEHVRTYA